MADENWNGIGDNLDYLVGQSDDNLRKLEAAFTRLDGDIYG